MWKQRKALICLILLLLLGDPLLAWGQEGIFLRESEAPKAVFPEAMTLERKMIPSDYKLREKISLRMGNTKTSLWERAYTIFIAREEDKLLGYAVVVEEIGKHRPITFIVGVEKNGRVRDVAVMVYREPYGSEVKDKRFLTQYEGKDLQAPLVPYRDIRNVTGATLSVEAISRGVKKALALVEVIYLHGEETK
ncbi:MAG: FMN-binding protein [Candidatus Binatia bacterium]